MWWKCFLLSSLVVSIAARCPNWCNKRGICTSPAEGGNCVCFMGFTGEDCSLRVCPSNFDPIGLESNPNRRAVRMEIGVKDGMLSGKYGFEFGGSEVYFPTEAARFTDAKCEETLKLGLKSVEDVTCVRESFNAKTNAATYLIRFLSYPESPPYMNNVIFHDGNPPLHMFNCNMSKIDPEDAVDPFCFISDVEPENGLPLPVYGECSLHGSCEQIKGECKCERGFKGPACADIRDNEDIIAHYHDGPFFAATVLKVGINRSPSSDFNIFQAKLAEQSVTTITGNKEMRHEGPVQVVHGDLTVVSSSAADSFATLRTDMSTESMLTEGDALQDIAYSSAAAIIAPPSATSNIRSYLAAPQLLKKKTDGTAPETVDYHMLAFQGDNKVFSLEANGSGNFFGGLSVGNGSFFVRTSTKGAGWVQASNVEVSNLLQVRGALQVEDTLTIGSGFSVSPTGISVDVHQHTGTLLELHSRATHFNGSVLEVHAEGEDCSIIKAVSDGLTTFELTSGGILQTQGLKLESGGVHVTSGGMQVDAGGLLVRGGLTVESGEMMLEQAQLRVGHVTAAASADELERTVITGQVDSPYYSGTILELTASINKLVNIDEKNNSNMDSHGSFSFLKFRGRSERNGEISNNTIFEIDCDGDIRSSAGAEFRGETGVSVTGPLRVDGDVIMGKITLLPVPIDNSADTSVSNVGATPKPTHYVLIPNSASYIVISSIDNKKGAPTRVRVEFEYNSAGETGMVGRVLIVSNMGHQTTEGALRIPSQSTVMFLHNGFNWISIEALKAPIQELRGVRVLEASNDLHIGNYSITARRFQATEIPRYRVLFAGVDGLLSDSDKFTYTKGILSAPALKIDKLLTTVDVRGNELSNAKLPGAQLTGALVSASELILPGQKGFAIFDEKGKLSGSSAFKLNEDGNILIDTFHTHVNAKGNSIQNVTIKDAVLENVRTAVLDTLVVSSMKTTDPSIRKIVEPVRARQSSMPLTYGYTMVAVDIDGNLLPASSTMRIDPSSGSLTISDLHSCTWTGKVDGNHQELLNPHIVGGQLSSVQSLSASTVLVEDLRMQRKHRGRLNEDGAHHSRLWAEASRLVFTDPDGKLIANPSYEHEVHIPKLSISQLSFKPTMSATGDSIDGRTGTNSGEFDFHGIALKNVHIDAASIDFTKQTSAFQVQTLKVASLTDWNNDHGEGDVGEGSLFLVAHTTEGKIKSVPSVGLKVVTSELGSKTESRTLLDITTTGGLVTSKVSTGEIQLIRPSSGTGSELNLQSAVVSIDKDGFMIGRNELDVHKLSASQSLTIASQASIKLEGRSGGTLLGLNEDGNIVPVEKTNSSSQRGNTKLKNNNNWNVELNSITADTVTAEKVTAVHVDASSFQLHYDGKVPPVGTLIITDEKGAMKASMKGGVQVVNDVLHAKTIAPLRGSEMAVRENGLEIKEALLTSANFSEGLIHNARSVDTKLLVVTDSAEFLDDVLIEGSITVQGSVIGSGPYVDSSDKRLKKDIHYLDGTLDKVMKLQAVKYHYRTEDFPHRKFPSSAQVGWLADDVGKVFPEIVASDNDGYGAIAYAHSSVLVAEAVKELKHQHDQEIAKLRDEVSQLKAMLDALLTK